MCSTSITVFCAGSLVDCGLRLSGQMGNGCTLQFHSAAQPIAQATLMITEIYFIFNNAKVLYCNNIANSY